MNPTSMPLYDNIILCLGRSDCNIHLQNVQTCAFKTFFMTFLPDLLDGRMSAASFLFLEWELRGCAAWCVECLSDVKIILQSVLTFRKKWCWATYGFIWNKHTNYFTRLCVSAITYNYFMYILKVIYVNEIVIDIIVIILIIVQTSYIRHWQLQLLS